jgi:hypothetical protein
MSFFVKLPKERYSPRAFHAFSSLASDFDPGTGNALAWVSQLAYETDEPDKIGDILELWEMRLADDGIVIEEVATVLPTVSTHCFVAGGRGATIVAFAGTDPVVLANWITDFDIRRGKTGSAEGFNVAASAVWPRLKPLIAKAAAANGRIFVTGHSLGGALAALIALKINSETVGDVQAVYTFGMPRPGDRTLADAYNRRLGQRTYRLVHGKDLVPTVAPTSLNFLHLGRHLHCERGSKFEPARLSPDATSNDPPFEEGISKELAAVLHGPISSLLSLGKRLNLAAALALGINPGGLRTDPGGIAIELLPPRLRDHMPDRYIGGF